MSIFGSDPFGTEPFASLGGGGSSGTNYTIGTTTVVFQGFAPVVTGASPLRVSQVARETLYAGNATARVAQLARETLYAGNSTAKVSQVARETLYAGNATARVAQVVREVLRSSSFTLTDDANICILW